ncbi:hypothetical protein BCCGELA001_08225 [Bradyrhizobium sp. CCGE-LA001]|nr:hypothetical protein BCCGELA001_08225 [Bradyrhizobium sp. CCGE-LA001]
MTLRCAPRTVRLSLGVNMQDHLSNFAPVRSFALRLQKANIRDNMLFVIRRQRRLDWRDILDVRI